MSVPWAGAALGQDNPDQAWSCDTSGIYLEDDDPFHWDFDARRGDFELFEGGRRGIEPQGIEGGVARASPTAASSCGAPPSSYPRMGLLLLGDPGPGPRGRRLLGRATSSRSRDRGFVM